jgi:hypothetical protein
MGYGVCRIKITVMVQLKNMPLNVIKQAKMSRRETLSQKFDELWDKANAIISAAKPCGIKSVNGEITCRGCSFHKDFRQSVYYVAESPNILCCGGCKYHEPNKGCIAEKPLMCKLWLCHSASKFLKGDKSLQLAEIKSQASDLGLLCFRGNKEESIQNALYRHRMGTI